MKKASLSQKEILNTGEAAVLMNVTPQTIKNYIYSGKLRSLKTPGGHHRIRRCDLEEIGFSLATNQAVPDFNRGDMVSQYNQLFEAYKKTVEVLLKALDRRDAIASGHSARVADYSFWMADMINLSDKERENIMTAALLHDIGKIEIKEEILSKRGKLTSEETAIIQRHPEIGERIVKDVDCLKTVQALIRHHHERFDGLGYPDGLRGEKIPIGARIISLAETYDFLRSELPFRAAFSPEASLAEIKKVSGTQLDPTLVKVFVDNVGRRAFL